MTDHCENTTQRSELAEAEGSPAEQETDTQSTIDSALEEASPLIPTKSHAGQGFPEAEDESPTITSGEGESPQKLLVANQIHGHYSQTQRPDYLQHQNSTDPRFGQQIVAPNNGPAPIPFGPQSPGYILHPQNPNMWLPTQYPPQSQQVPLYPCPASCVPQEFVARPLVAQYQVQSQYTRTAMLYISPNGTPQRAIPSERSNLDENASATAADDPSRQPKGERRHQCGKCGKRFLRPSALKQHFRVHTGEKPFPCPFENCPRNEKGKPFSVLSNMTRHVKMTHRA